MKYDITPEENKIALDIYVRLGQLSISRSKVVLNEVMRLVKELAAALEEKTTLKEAEDL